MSRRLAYDKDSQDPGADRCALLLPLSAVALLPPLLLLLLLLSLLAALACFCCRRCCCRWRTQIRHGQGE
jgi:hypothetical protein